ncbi:hypothetical protein [uncultured Polaribacter sp.]|uniref:hypothetical protein n=1 Tax=uncultured Polaribacter sp. TaxID=174711 RepID=UPI002606AB51|nr:hypothetical protein [uncultured Polaribacter sp.]
MAKKGKKNKGFDIPDPKKQLENAINSLSKYKVGEQGIPFHSVKNLKPFFAFDYLSLDKTDLCFNCKTNNRDDLLGLLEGLKKVSSYTYESMRLTKALRFHSINLWDKEVNLQPKDFLKILAPSYRGMTENELPTLYQFDLQYTIEARAVGFLYKGIFYLVWYDRNHIIYPKK